MFEATSGAKRAMSIHKRHAPRTAGPSLVRHSARLMALPLVLGLSACSSMVGTTYGTGETQEQALMRDVGNLFGAVSRDDKEPIDYSARAGLVMPPQGTQLPAPQNRSSMASSTASNWPQDPDALRQLYQERVKDMSDAEREQLLAEIRKLPKEQRDAIFKNDPRSTAFVNDIKEPDPLKASAQELAEYERQVQERKALIRLQNDGSSTGRKYLTQPPERVTDLTPEVKEQIAQIEKGEQKSEKRGLGRLWPF